MKCLKALLLIMIFASQALMAQEVKVIKFPELQEIINKKSEKIKLINFWATWCKPCIEELPYFEEAEKKYGKDELEIIFVSFDFTVSQVNNYLKKHKLTGKLYLLDETDFDAIINKVDKGWQGGIPATLVVGRQGGSKAFYEKQFDDGELDIIIEKLVK